jgi:hypothetical protein
MFHQLQQIMYKGLDELGAGLGTDHWSSHLRESEATMRNLRLILGD